MKILHIGNLKSGIDTYVRNTVALASDKFEFVIVNGADDNSKPYMRHGKQHMRSRLFEYWFSSYQMKDKCKHPTPILAV